jgi:hypothetical protein
MRLKGRKDFTPEIETTAIDNPFYQGTTFFEYENLDNSL